MDSLTPTKPKNSKMLSNLEESARPAALEEPSLRPVALDFDRTDAVFFSTPAPPAVVDPVEGFEEFYLRRNRDSERRRRMAMPYVGVALGLLLTVLGAGLIRQHAAASETVLASSGLAAETAMTGVRTQAPGAATQAERPRGLASAPVAERAPNATAATPTATEKAATGAGTDSDPKPVVDAKPAIDAKSERRDATRALERGRIKDAVGHAKLATEADETDAEGWLLLGAALQADSNFKSAREAFVQCTKLAKRGPKSECAALLH
jgi:hypothetical protein